MSNEQLSEKVSVNMNSSVLSSIDLLVDNGFFSNRSDFINQAVREALNAKQSTLDRIIEKNSERREGNSWFIGLSGYTKKDISEMYGAGDNLEIKGYGVLVIDSDCNEDEVKAVIKSINVRGKVHCSRSLKEYYKIK